MTETEQLTHEELWDLSELADAHADHFDYDEEVCEKFNDLRDKLQRMAKAMKGESK